MPIYEKLMGNSFVDAGASVLCQWLDTEPEDITIEDLKQAVKDIVPLMDNPALKKNLHSIFPNSTLVNTSIKEDRKKRLTREFNEYISEIKELGKTGDCIGCGRREANHRLTKTDIPLTGSGGLVNFFPSFDSGAGYCSACRLAIQFSPWSFVTSGGRFLAASSNSWQAVNLWTRTCISDITQKILRGEDAGCYNPGFSNPRNALFFMTGKMIEFGEINEDASIQVFCFTNFNQGPTLEVFYLPAPVFRFLRYANQAEYKPAWNSIVQSGYQKVNWNKVQSEEDYKNKHNKVYEYLLNEQSIISFFVDLKNRGNRGDWSLLSLYLKEVKNMQEERITAIKRVADNIAESIRKSGRDKRLKQLENAKYYREFQNVLLFIIKDRLKLGEPDPLFTLDEYLDHLFPSSEDGISPWNETRYLLLFRIYERLHEWLKDSEIIEEIIEEELSEDINPEMEAN
ncbi:MAG TPA: type I-B CRISPR-associated protein Cas8b1/Cst1 [Thermodesulfobacteriota bacterium]|nr:type I-B CRISPR-associated protein Cas8b1/Cst1 [Thermodesulfobacteriota bacterium]